MLQVFRDNKQSFWVYLIFGVIILTFVVMFGLPSTDIVSSGGNMTVAEVGKHEIDHELLRSMRLRYYDDRLKPEEMRAVSMLLVEQLAAVYILADAAQEAGLRVSTEELNDYITNPEAGNPDVIGLGFYRNNRFSKSYYEDALQRIQIPTGRYEEFKRHELLAKRYTTLLASSLAVSDNTLWQNFAIQEHKANVEAIILTEELVARTFLPATEAEIQAFKNANADTIKAAYEAKISQYTTPERIRLQQIIIQKDYSKLGNIGEKTVKTQHASERFTIAKRKVFDEGLDFATAFKDYDEAEIKADEGLGPELALKDLDPILQTALKEKGVDSLIHAELPDRYIIARVVDRKPLVIKGFDEVEATLSKEVFERQRNQAKLKAVSEEILAKAKTGQDFNTLIQDVLYAGVLTEPPAKEQLPPLAPEDEDDETILAERAEAQRQIDQAYQVSLDKIVIIPENQRLKSKRFDQLPLNSTFLPGIGIHEALARDLRQAQDGQVLTQSYELSNNIVLAKLLEQIPAKREDFEAQKDSLRQSATQNKIQALIGDINSIGTNNPNFGLWLNHRVQKAKSDGLLHINQRYFNRFNQSGSAR